METTYRSWDALANLFSGIAPKLTRMQARADFLRTEEGWFEWGLDDAPAANTEFRQAAKDAGTKLLEPGVLSDSEREEIAKLDAVDRWLAYLYKRQKNLSALDVVHGREEGGKWENVVASAEPRTTKQTFGHISDIASFSETQCRELAAKE